MANAGLARNPIRKERITIAGTVPDGRSQETGVRGQKKGY